VLGEQELQAKGSPALAARSPMRARQGRFLLARGFSAEAVRRVLAWDPDEDGGA
jgi:SOS response regulatory protein OraA/RecX